MINTKKIIAISGDSGSGKTTLCKILTEIFQPGTVLHFETDRYHKWERDHPNWKVVSHLNPDSNYLERLEYDLVTLKSGNSISVVDYDHYTGKFTSPMQITPAQIMLVCGLHTLYLENIRKLCSIKIFMDTDEDLKREWKIDRDVNKRGKNINDVIAQIEHRRNDYHKYVLIQREYADMIIKYKRKKLLISIKSENFNKIISILKPIISAENNWIKLKFDDPNIKIPNTNKSGYSGIIQFIVIMLLNSNG